MKKIFALFLMMILLAPSFPTAAKTNVQRVSVYKGKTVTVKSSLKKATYSSTDTSIATVNSKGKIKGVSEGECYVIATRKGKSEVFAVSVLGKGTSKMDAKAKITVYLAGHKVTCGETTLKEIFDMFLGSDYNVSCYVGDEDMHRIICVSIWKKDRRMATIYFANYTGLVGMPSDGTVLDVAFGNDVQKDGFHYELDVSNMPNYDKFDANDYFYNLDPRNIDTFDYGDGWGENTKSITVYTGGYYWTFIFARDTGKFIEYFARGMYD